MGLELALLSAKTGARALRFDLRRQGGGLRLSRPKAKPHHSHRAHAPERARRAQTELKTWQGLLRQRIGDGFDDREIDVADKPNSEVEVLRRRPPELRRDARASGDEASQHLSLRLRNRQPEEGADPQRTRAFFFQFS